ncbi:MAG: hypothetical protein E7645_02965 [Ruminococcaceae bacterium]|nr:hypothetical protein [Oscillospiraceae bacterium]
MDSRTYKIATLPAGTLAENINWEAIPSACVDNFFWYVGHAPTTTAKLVYVEGFGFILRMICEEINPKAVYQNYNDPVYTDSCMEFFCDWLGDGRYINMEMNSLGTLLSCIGPDRHARTPVADLSEGELFPVNGAVCDGYWQVTAEIPTALLCKILGVSSIPFGKGYTFRGNFYKCGDKTAVIHYGMWNPIGTEKADFHRPEYFGTLIID